MNRLTWGELARGSVGCENLIFSAAWLKQTATFPFPNFGSR
ncbi:hypothetical protein Mal33_30320 [Rosistilla oblonga]|uniref:Uncharacterized protein n=1 Tax=Rosistilla oblonga TaxID=2527990 RepID=A0A518IVB4_9BACT|nr:hypothetical protein Mal33_30320 [Rosistilla oblonga]